jgi:protein gp37
MADVFEARADLNSWRERLWPLIEATPHLDWLLLTKRPEHIGRSVPWRKSWPSNVWLGTTAETQRWADERLPELLRHPAAIRFVSCEPLLGPVDISRWLHRVTHRVDWVIAGGESGHNARPMNPEWARSLRDQCRRARVPFHFKQWGHWRPGGGDTDGHRVRELRDSSGAAIQMVSVGKKLAGRKLDGQEWNGVPWGA